MNKKNITLAIIAAVLAAGVLISLTIIQNARFRLVGSTPRLGSSLSTSTSTIKLDFNRDIDNSQEYTDSLTGDLALIKSISVDKKSIYLKLVTLKENQHYSLALNNIRSADGKVITKLPVEFTAKYVAFNKLPVSQRQLETTQTDKNNTEDPILAILPHQGESFYLSGSYSANDAGEPIFILDAQLFLKRADLGAKHDSAISGYKKTVHDFIKSKGFDPDKYLIRYDINEPPSN